MKTYSRLLSFLQLRGFAARRFSAFHPPTRVMRERFLLPRAASLPFTQPRVLCANAFSCRTPLFDAKLSKRCNEADGEKKKAGKEEELYSKECM